MALKTHSRRRGLNTSSASDAKGILPRLLLRYDSLGFLRGPGFQVRFHFLGMCCTSVFQDCGPYSVKKLRGPAVCRRKEVADGTALRSQRPRCLSKNSKKERGENVKGVRSITADRSAGCGRVCQVEEDACIRPSLEPPKTRHQYGNGSKHFSKPPGWRRSTLGSQGRALRHEGCPEIVPAAQHPRFRYD